MCTPEYSTRISKPPSDKGPRSLPLVKERRAICSHVSLQARDRELRIFSLSHFPSQVGKAAVHAYKLIPRVAIIGSSRGQVGYDSNPSSRRPSKSSLSCLPTFQHAHPRPTDSPCPIEMQELKVSPMHPAVCSSAAGIVNSISVRNFSQMLA